MRPPKEAAVRIPSTRYPSDILGYASVAKLMNPLNPTHPRSCISFISLMLDGINPAQNAKSTTDRSPAIPFFSSKPGLSMVAGSDGRGMSHMVVMPPEAALQEPQYQSSRKLNGPGSAIWLWVSIMPGITIFPIASITSHPAGGSIPLSSNALILPLSTNTEPSDTQSGSTTLPLTINFLSCFIVQSPHFSVFSLITS